ncbi:hypothetical protein Sfulv_14610 [Streptomyces fulvorobeus]|uniref:Uncharacterized protein n=1 Tax=Streptomyces fulvorobeus TaxID=284028 RepID=A0A7J0C2C0_9ACTN|nr:hypothetical protein Sfulv_14610 [Streptomyces fulvorobeus]
MPRAGGGEDGSRGEVEQQRVIDQEGGRGARPLAAGTGAHGAGTFGARQPVGGSGAEQSQFHVLILPRPGTPCAPGRGTRLWAAT